MAVIYLPEDKRAALVGQGLGDLVGAYVGQRIKQADDQRVLSQIQSIQSDQSIKPQDKPFAIGQGLGLKGIALYNALQKTNLQQITAQKDVAQTNLANKNVERIDQTMSEQAKTAPLQRANIASEIKTRETELPVRMENLQSEIVKRASEIEQMPLGEEKKRAELGLAQLKIQEAQESLNQQKTLAGVFADSDKAKEVQDQLKITDPQMAGAHVGAAVGGPKGFLSAVRGAQSANRAADKPSGSTTLPEAEITKAGNTAQQAQTLGSLVGLLEKDPKAFGGPTAKITAWAQKYGLFQGDPELNLRATISEQLVADSVKTGAGFVGKERINLAHDTLPSLQQGKARQLIELNTILQGELANAETRRAGFGDRYNAAPMDHAIDELRKQAEVTDSFWWTGDKKARFFFKGKEVNGETLQPVKDGAKEFGAGEKVTIGTQDFSGDKVNAYARRKGLTPEAAVEALKKVAEQ